MNGQFEKALLVFGVICGVVGWGVIGLAIYALSFVHITLG